mgnify:CR=1 FL=1
MSDEPKKIDLNAYDPVDGAPIREYMAGTAAQRGFAEKTPYDIAHSISVFRQLLDGVEEKVFSGQAIDDLRRARLIIKRLTTESKKT